MNLTFKERVAQIIGRIAPEWCVKKHYGMDSTWCWNLSSEKEIEIIKKLNLQENDGLSNRFWDPSTRIYLIEQGVYDCIPQISTQGEFSALLNCIPKLPVDVLIKALGFYTPGSQLLLRMINKLDGESLSQIVKYRPYVFNDLKLDNLFNDFEDNDVDYSKEYSLLASLLEANSKRWCEKVITYFKSISKPRITEEARYFLEEAFMKSIEQGMKHADDLVYLYTNYPSVYASAKQQVVFNKEYGMKMLTYFLSNTTSLVEFDPKDKGEAQYWVKALTMRKDNEILSFMRSHYEELQQLKLDCGAMTDVWVYMLEMSDDYASWEFCYERADSSPKKSMARKKLAYVLKTSADCMGARKYFPFTEWEEDSVKGILYRLVENSQMPLSKLSLLSDNLREYVDYLMVTRSQKLVLEQNCGKVWMDLFEKTKLTPDAECFMLRATYKRGDDKIAYIGKYGLSDKAFKFLLNCEYTLEDGFSYLKAFLIKQGLSSEQYRLVMQSKYASQAPFIKEYLK